ncbi:MAG: response regulator transcription factor [Acidobacteriota bacterium]
MMSQRKPIAILESFWALRAGLASALDEGGFQVVRLESADQLDTSFSEKGRQDYSLFVLGPGSHHPTACGAVRQLQRLRPLTPVLVVFDFPSRLEVVQVLRSGAQSCISRKASQEDFVSAAKSALRGRRYLDPSVAGLLCDAVAQDGPTLQISNRESQVLTLLCKGHVAQEIAERLEVSRYTVESHKKSLMRKLDVRSQLKLVARARQLRLAP